MSSPFSQADVLSLYRRLAPAPFLQRLCRQAGLRQNNRIYTLAVVLWLMIGQWLEGHGSLEQALMALRPTRGHENAPDSRYALIDVVVDEVGTALEQSSPSASLIRNARLNQ